ncbi:hypothetical protein C5B89_19120, partial [Haloferax sp. Atlit-47N]
KIEVPLLDEDADVDITDIGPGAETDPPADVLLRRLEDEGVMRYGELVEQDTLQVRKTLDRLETDGAIERFAVGEHIMVKLLADDVDGLTVR